MKRIEGRGGLPISAGISPRLSTGRGNLPPPAQTRSGNMAQRIAARGTTPRITARTVSRIINNS